jgi:hypothetical protein
MRGRIRAALSLLGIPLLVKIKIGNGANDQLQIGLVVRQLVTAPAQYEVKVNFRKLQGLLKICAHIQTDLDMNTRHSARQE